jgi:hypothetical protein
MTSMQSPDTRIQIASPPHTRPQTTVARFHPFQFFASQPQVQDSEMLPRVHLTLRCIGSPLVAAQCSSFPFLCHSTALTFPLAKKRTYPVRLITQFEQHDTLLISGPRVYTYKQNRHLKSGCRLWLICFSGSMSLAANAWKAAIPSPCSWLRSQTSDKNWS